ncbi:MAG TPA: TonB-dependent receptor [Bacteroidales bacterium]|jgi:hypothetical protein|nr:TonB-dependent receptor [Bacteroidales bacterium]HQJ82204.1 TonB-dependent receptor [Bacteroidales bacterium]
MFAFLILQIIALQVPAQKVTVSGYISDAGSGERMIGAAVYEKTSLTGSTSNNYGFYSLQLPRGDQEIIVSYLGYEQESVLVNLTSDTIINFNLEQSVRELETVTITAYGSQNKIKSSVVSMIDIPIEKFRMMPVLLGEADVLKIIQLLPGVQSGTEGSAGIYVRGGGPDQNLFLLDGVPVYNASHLFGFMSVFNPDAVKSVQLYKGGFPARYGERLSSVVDIRTREGNEKEFHGSLSVGLIASKFTAEGPIVKDKTSFIISGRRTYADILAQPFIAMGNKDPNYKSNGGYFFYDLNAKINHKFSEKSRLYLSSYLGKDKAYLRYKDTPDYYEDDGHKYEYTDRIGMGWGNIITSLRWNLLISNKIFSNSTLTYSNYKFDVTTEYLTRDITAKMKYHDYFRYFSGIEDIGVKTDFDYYPGANHTVRFGAGYTYHHFKPGVTRISFSASDLAGGIDTTFGDQKIYAGELIAYAEDDFDITARIKINAGLRLSLLNVQDAGYLSLQPRVSLRFLATDDLSFKASYSRMTQFVHLLTTSSVSLPTDLWLPVTRKFRPPLSDQIAVGSYFRLPWQLDMTIEGFYKSMDYLIEYREGASFTGSATGWESKVVNGKGWAYGVEFLIEKSLGKTSGWIGYTLSKTLRKFDELNFGRTFPAKYDRRHDVSIALTHKFNERIDIGSVWIYGSGNAVTLGIMEYSPMDYFIPRYFRDEKITEFPYRNNYRAPAYHRLDLSLNLHKKKNKGIRTWNFAIYNVYNRRNPFFIFWDDEYFEEADPFNPGMTVTTARPVLKKASLFPIIPSVTYSFIF